MWRCDVARNRHGTKEKEKSWRSNQAEKKWWHPEQIILREKKLGVDNQAEKEWRHPEQITLREKKVGVEPTEMG